MNIKTLATIAALALATSMYAEVVSNDVTYATFNGTIELSHVAFQSVSTGTIDPTNTNIAYGVQSGSQVELTGFYTLTETATPPVPCPDCEVQDYLAFEQPNATGSVGIPGIAPCCTSAGDNFSTGPTAFDLTMIFTANDGGAGTYYIGEDTTLQFSFLPNQAGHAGLDGVSFSAEIDNVAPEPASVLMLGMGLVGIGVGIRRKIAR